MPRTRHDRRRADVPALIRALDAHEVRYVIAGSVAVQIWGVGVEPNDLDIAPDLSPDNLTRLAELLEEIEATPDAFGHWIVRDDGERGWIEEETTPEQIDAWVPLPADTTTLDHLFRTKHGDLDVVPSLCGGYDQLLAHASERDIDGHAVPVADVVDLLAAMTVPRRAKDRDSIAQLREIQRRT